MMGSSRVLSAVLTVATVLVLTMLSLLCLRCRRKKSKCLFQIELLTFLELMRVCVDLWLHFAEGTFHAFHYLFGPFNTIKSRYMYMYIFDVCVAAHTRVVGGGSSCCEMEPLSLLFEEQHVGILSLHVLQKLLKSNIKSTTRKCCEYPAVMPLGQTLLKWKTELFNFFLLILRWNNFLPGTYKWLLSWQPTWWEFICCDQIENR